MASRRTTEAGEEARAAEAAAVEAESVAREREGVLRSKLEELWRLLREVKPAEPRDSLAGGFAPPARH